MVTRAKHNTTTIEHQPPASTLNRRPVPLFLMAYPKPLVLPRPPLGETVGRDWLAEHGHVDPKVSASHLAFVRKDGAIAVMDERSRNGVYVDGERLIPGEIVGLVDGSILRIGKTLLVYREAHATPEPASPIGRLVGPWGLTSVRKSLGQLNALQSEGLRNVLIEGETGTGKELVAEAVAQAFRRRARYGIVNMGAISSGVFEAHLFGWKRGAFSGSGEGGPGVFARYDGGAVFLDEIGDLPIELQPKLLRLLDNQEVQMVGAAAPTIVDVRIIAATNRDLKAMVAAGTFRRDLLARFDKTLELPALRDRPEDLHAILSALAVREKLPIDPTRVEVEAVERLLLHSWPMNIRELRSLLFGLDPPGVVSLAAVERALGKREASARSTPLTPELIDKALAACGGNESAAARHLGVSRGALLRARRKLSAL